MRGVCGALSACATRTRPLNRWCRWVPPRATSAGRLLVGVAFGGGSARGLAHVGVIRWFEEHRIPIDLVAGPAWADSSEGRSRRHPFCQSISVAPPLTHLSPTGLFLAAGSRDSSRA